MVVVGPERRKWHGYHDRWHTFIYIVGAHSPKGKMKTKVDKTASLNSAYFRFSFFTATRAERHPTKLCDQYIILNQDVHFSVPFSIYRKVLI